MAEQIPLKWDDAASVPARFGATDTVPPGNLGTGTRDDTKFLRADGTWQVPTGGGGGGGSGDVTGPVSSTDNTLPRWDGTGGDTLQGSGVAVSDANAITGVASIDVTGNITVGGTVDGVDIAADAAALTAHVGAGGAVHADVVAAGASGFMTGDDKTKLDAIAAGAEVNSATNLTATAAGGGVGVYASKSGSTLQLRPIVPARQVVVSQTGNDVRVGYDRSRYMPREQRHDRFRPYRTRGLWVAGATAAAPSVHGPNLLFGLQADGVTGQTISVASGTFTRPAGGTSSWLIEGFSVGNVLTISGFSNAGNNTSRTIASVTATTITPTDATGMIDEANKVPSMNSYTEHLYPFMVATALDYEGYPHDRHQRLEASLASGAVSETLGYAAGEYVAASEFRSGSRIVWDGTGYIENDEDGDAFFEFCLEPNVTVAGAPNYAGSNRMRLLSGELGQTWSGQRPFKYRIELYNEGNRAYSYWGEFLIAGGAGQVAIRREVGGRVSSGFNFASTDAQINMRWRVDRIANLNTYDDTYQGLDLKLGIVNYGVSAEGF